MQITFGRLAKRYHFRSLRLGPSKYLVYMFLNLVRPLSACRSLFDGSAVAELKRIVWDLSTFDGFNWKLYKAMVCRRLHASERTWRQWQRLMRFPFTQLVSLPHVAGDGVSASN